MSIWALILLLALIFSDLRYTIINLLNGLDALTLIVLLIIVYYYYGR